MNDQEVFNLSLAIAPLLPGWEMQTDTDDQRAYFVNGGMKFAITRDWRGKKDRVNVETWAWPTYTEAPDRGYEKRETITPRCLYNPEESSPSISCAIARGGIAIASEINRRFLPEYERIYARCAEKVAINQEYENTKRDNWVAVCTLLGKSPNSGLHYVEAKGLDHMTVKQNTRLTRVEIDATPEQVAKILQALGVE